MSSKHYKAFISYSHDNEEFGAWLHKQLEKYKIPKRLREDYPHLPKTLYPIFRDRYELNAGDDLGVEISRALKKSDALIVVCPTKSANSKWVNKEIIDFKMKHGEERIFPIIVDGVPFAKESDKYDNNLEYFPEALKYEVDSEGNLTDVQTDKLASDFNKSEDGEELAKLKLIAGVLGVPFGIFNDREKQEQNKRRAFLIGSLGVVSSLAGISGWKWIEADEKTLKVRKMLYESIMKQGLMYRDDFNNPIQAQHFFSKAINQSMNKEQERKAKFIYNSNIEYVSKLNFIMEHPKCEYRIVYGKNNGEHYTCVLL